MSESTLSVRAALPADLVALQELVTSTLGESLGTVLPNEELSAFAREYRDGSAATTCYVAEAGGALAGYAVMAREGTTWGPVERLYVRRGAEGDTERDVAAALVSAVCDESERPIPVTNDRQTAMALYDRWGFVDMGAVRRCLSLPSGHGRLLAVEAR
jgi:hypothetical protein